MSFFCQRLHLLFIFVLNLLLLNSICHSMAATNATQFSPLRNAFLFGASGATGTAFVDLLCGGKHSASFVNHVAAIPASSEPTSTSTIRKLVAVTRRVFDWNLVATSPKPFGAFQLENQVIDFEDMQTTLAPKFSEFQEKHGPVDVVFCAHGTTAKQAGSDAAFFHIDHDYTVEIARQAKAAGVKHFSLISSVMVDPKSSFLYPRTKGQTIEDIKALGFERFSVFKPGLLITEKRPDTRIGESIAVALDPFISWISKASGIEALKPLQSIKVEDLAASMIANAMRPSPTPGTSYEEYDTSPDILALKHKTA